MICEKPNLKETSDYKDEWTFPLTRRKIKRKRRKSDKERKRRRG